MTQKWKENNSCVSGKPVSTKAHTRQQAHPARAQRLPYYSPRRSPGTQAQRAYLLDRLDVIPVGAGGGQVLLLAQAAVHGQHAAARALDEARVVHSVLDVREPPDLAAYGRGVHTLRAQRTQRAVAHTPGHPGRGSGGTAGTACSTKSAQDSPSWLRPLRIVEAGWSSGAGLP